MGNWFGDLDLAYKYTVVFVSLLVLVFVAGLIKVFFDRRKIKKFTEEQNVETGRREDQVELNQREKDEGDLFGIRAIEAGFYAGIPQSRPTSRAGSVIASPSMSSSTLIGGQSLNTPKLQSHSMNSSVTTLPLAHTNERYRDSDVLPVNDQSRRKSPPTIKLQPSEAEMNGRINHTTTVNMTLNVPPSPVSTRHQTPSPTFGSSDDGDISPRSANFAEHYAPAPPQIPMPDGLRVAVHPPESTAQSQTASLAGPSANSSSRSSLGQGPETKLPSMPSKAMMDDARAEAWVQQSSR